MIFVTGGTGFIGRALVRQLVEMDLPVRMLLRPSASSPKLPRGVPVEVAVCSLKDERGLRAALKDVDVVFHLAGTERYGSRADLTGVDVEGSQALAAAANQAGVRRIFFLSHLGADRSSAYPVMRAKALAESSIIHSGQKYTIFRSAAVYGPNDQFTTSIVQLLRVLPFGFLLPGNGGALLQPIWIDDLVACMTLALEDEHTENRIYEVGGGETFSFREIVETLMSVTHMKRFLIPLNPVYVRSLGLFVEESMKNFPISLFWLDYLAVDRTCALDALPRHFGLMPARFLRQLDYLRDERRMKSRN